MTVGEIFLPALKILEYGLKYHCFSLNMFEWWENIYDILITLTDVSWFAACWYITPVGLLSDRM